MSKDNSTDSEERQALSIEAQLRELQEFATREQLEIVLKRAAAGGGWFSGRPPSPSRRPAP